MKKKPDYPPLLAPGYHVLTLSQVEALCVTRFPRSSTRHRLYYLLEQLIQDLLAMHICCEIWVDGSFLTEKDDPSDIDIALMLEHDAYDSLDEAAKDLIDQVRDWEYLSKKLEGLVIVCYPSGHQLFTAMQALRQETVELFNLEHSEQWLRGVAVIRVGETDVGLRLRS